MNQLWRFTALLAILLLITGSCDQASRMKLVKLPHSWKFMSGDDPAWSQAGLDDSDWDSILVDDTWDDQGYGSLNGFAWYRACFFLPRELKTSSVIQDSLQIYLGKIDDYDQVYLNGKLLGENGKTLPAGTSPDNEFIDQPTPWYKERHYMASVNDPRLKWNKENVIAVRVYDSGGLGGMYEGLPVVRMSNIKDYLIVDYAQAVFDMEKQRIIQDFTVSNKANTFTISGVFRWNVITEIPLRSLTQGKTTISLSPGEKRDYSIEIPVSDQSAVLKILYTHLETNTSVEFSRYLPYLCTPEVSEKPRINGPVIVGARRGRPFLFAVPCSGATPLTYRAKGLPSGLVIDSKTGIISGKVLQKGIFKTKISAENEIGTDTSLLTIQVGDQIALTPPMGWNSWNCWGLSVDSDKVLAAARAFKDSQLSDHGWAYINIDDGWEIPRDDPREKRDARGNIITNQKFPDMKALGESIHALGLKFGIYSSPGPFTCGGYTASYSFEQNDANSYASWGIDYLKYDWCSYGQIATDRSLAELKKPYYLMRECLDRVNRDIVYSLCQYGMGDVWEWGHDVGGNLWRTTGDIVDTWESLSSIGFSQVENAPYAGPGHWNDPDMLVVGWVGWGPQLHYTRLTPSEQYTHMSLWCLLSAPLLIGCDLERLDPFTLNLLTNDEVLAIDQDPLGKQAIPVIIDGKFQVWLKDMADGTHAIGIFNLGERAGEYQVYFSDIGLENDLMLRDIWRQQDLGDHSGSFKAPVPAHGAFLLRTN